jgi:predicted GIY-YIG superfamily endonuclease
MKPLCFVYLIGSITHNWYKIGMSADPMKRYKTLESALPFPLTLMHTQPMRSRRQAKRVEYALHRHFGHLRLHGEWFHDIDFGQFWNFLRRQ